MIKKNTVSQILVVLLLLFSLIISVSAKPINFQEGVAAQNTGALPNENFADAQGEGLSEDDLLNQPLYFGLGVICLNEERANVIDINQDDAKEYVIIEAYDVANGNTVEQEFATNFYASNQADNEKYHAYEGTCTLMTAFTFDMSEPLERYITVEDEVVRKFASIVPNGKFTTTPLGSTQWSMVTSEEFQKKVEWDANKADCLALTQSGEQAWAGDEYATSGHACCGDDYIWVMNKLINHDQYLQGERSAQNICLYDWPGMSNDFLSQTPQCQITPEESHYAYDLNQKIDDTLTFQQNHFSQGAYVENGIGRITDIGLTMFDNEAKYCHTWFDQQKGQQFAWMDLQEAMQISNDLDGYEPDSKKEFAQYVKHDIRTKGGDLEQFDDTQYNVCELYLGGTSTGTMCCGAGVTPYNSEPLLKQSFNDPGTYTSPSIGVDVQLDKGACVDGNYVDPKTPYTYTVPVTSINGIQLDKPKDTPIASFIAVEGEVLGCKVDEEVINGPFKGKLDDSFTGELILKDENNKDHCEYVIRDTAVDANLKTIAFCDANNEWKTFDAALGEVATQFDEDANEIQTIFDTTTPGPGGFTNPNNGDLETITLTKSKVPEQFNVDPAQPKSACCFDGGCWNGNECVSLGSTQDITNNGQEETWGCFESQWYGPLEPTYNWYHDTAEEEQFCFMPYSCTCPSKQYSNGNSNEACDEQFLFGSDDADNMPSTRCTNEPFFFKEDHICEPNYVEEYVPQEIPPGEKETQFYKASSADWTSRTKFLAFSLIKYADQKGVDYTLFCDKPERSINAPNLLKEAGETNPPQEFVNSFCVLETSDGDMLIATSLNPDENGNFKEFDIQNILLGVPGFIPNERLFSEEDFKDTLDACDSAINLGSHALYGQYVKCQNPDAVAKKNVFFNNKTKSLIYSKKSIEFSGPAAQLNVADVQEYNELFASMNGLVTDMLDIYALAPSFVQELENSISVDDVSMYHNIKDYNGLYIVKLGNGVTANKNVLVFGVNEQKANPSDGSFGVDKVVNFGYVTFKTELFASQTESQICKQIEEAAGKYSFGYASVYCTWNIIAPNKVHVLTQAKPFTNPDKFWIDLSAKLRVQQ